MSDKFTQGLWETKGDANAVGVVVFSQDRIPIAICNPVSICTGSGAIKRYTGEEAAANAQLIAAAPELLEALNCLLHATMHRDHPAESDMAIAAIAKATLRHNVKLRGSPASGESRSNAGLGAFYATFKDLTPCLFFSSYNYWHLNCISALA